MFYTSRRAVSMKAWDFILRKYLTRPKKGHRLLREITIDM